MKPVHDGECGLCVHFGKHEKDVSKLIQIRRTHEAPEDLVEECGLPEHAAFRLQVTPTSGCTGFTPAPMEAR